MIRHDEARHDAKRPVKTSPGPQALLTNKSESLATKHGTAKWFMGESSTFES